MGAPQLPDVGVQLLDFRLCQQRGPRLEEVAAVLLGGFFEGGPAPEVQALLRLAFGPALHALYLALLGGDEALDSFEFFARHPACADVSGRGSCSNFARCGCRARATMGDVPAWVREKWGRARHRPSWAMSVSMSCCGAVRMRQRVSSLSGVRWS